MRHILLLISFFWLAAAHANVEVTCVNNDCLTNGWEIYDEFKDESVSVVCRNSDCAKEGWTGVFKNVAENETQCKAGDCFKNGWLIYSPQSGHLVADITCRADTFGATDCLIAGWNVNDYANRVSQTVYCINRDCRNIGWDVLVPGYPRMATRCKFGGCFQAGWINYRY